MGNCVEIDIFPKSWLGELFNRYKKTLFSKYSNVISYQNRGLLPRHDFWTWEVGATLGPLHEMKCSLSEVNLEAVSFEFQS